MYTRESVIKILAEREVVMMNETDFARDLQRSPVSKGGVACRYFAYRLNGANKGQRVSIKVLTPSTSDKIEASEKTNRDFAGEKTWLYFQRECCILKQGEDHPNIQRCLGIVNQFVGSTLPGIVFEDIAVSDFQTFTTRDERATNAMKLKLVRDVTCALKFLHGEKIMHRDLKANNVLVDEKNGKLVALLSDFGSAKDFGSVLPKWKTTNKASLQWLAPELWKEPNLMHDFEHGARGDMWALGCTMIEVFAVAKLVWSTDDEEVIQEALDLDMRPGRPTSFPAWDKGWNFIHDRCLHPIPSVRITADQAVGELEALQVSVPA